jgi:hypothetical protein
MEGDYIPKHAINLTETNLFWKHTARCTFVSSTEKTTPGIKAAKDQYTLIQDANISKEYKLRHLMVHPSQNPQALKGCVKNRTACCIEGEFERLDNISYFQ